MPDVINCPSCRRRLLPPDPTTAAMCQCPACGVTFAAGAVDEPVVEYVPRAPVAAARGALTPPPLPEPPPQEVRRVAPVLAEPSTEHEVEAEPARLKSGELAKLDEGLKRCPACNQTVRKYDHVCRYCGADLESDDDDVRPRRQPHRAGLVLILGGLSLLSSPVALCFPLLGVFGLALGFTAWALAANDLHKMSQRIMDHGGMVVTNAGKRLGQIGAVVTLLAAILNGFILWQ